MVKIRSLRDFAMSHIVFCPEANLAFEARHLADEVRRWRLDPITFIQDDRKGDNFMSDGIRIDHDSKAQMVYELRDHFTDATVFLYEDYFSLGRDGRDSALCNFADQLLNFSRVVVKRRGGNEDLYNKPRVEFTGKLSGPDDLVCAFLIAMRAHAIVETDPQFENLRSLTR